ncbi:MAG: LytR family transcriptional regulator [Lachnospiraceae bacterium]|nr:LytR family transcriptional regulator [Lachnospiraceae bacterium]
MKKRTVSKIGLIFYFLLTAVVGFFIWRVHTARLLPEKYEMLGIAFLVCLLLFIGMLFVKSRQSRSKVSRFFAGFFAFILGLCLFAGSVYGALMLNETKDVLMAFAGKDGTDVDLEKPFVMYVSGSDTRSKKLDKGRSDVNILMAVNPKTHKILLLNTPRDYYIPNPAGGGVNDKLTHCGMYGIDNSMKALADFYGVKVEHYGQINFTGFEKLIDALGGITVDSPADFTTYKSNIHFTKGINECNGKKALAYARERHAFATGDNARGEHQMEVITAMIKKASDNKVMVLANYGSILDSLDGTFVSDFSEDSMSGLVRLFLDGAGKWKISRFAVTGSGGRSTTYSTPNSNIYVTYPDPTSVETAKKKLNWYLKVPEEEN